MIRWESNFIVKRFAYPVNVELNLIIIIPGSTIDCIGPNFRVDQNNMIMTMKLGFL